MSKKIVIYVVAMAACLGLGFWLALDRPSSASAPEPLKVTPQPVTVTDAEAEGAASTRHTQQQAELRALAQQMRNQYGHLLGNPHWRMKLIGDLVSWFKQQYPIDWQQRLQAFLRAEFPDMAEDLLAKLDAYLEFTDWMANIKTTLKFGSMAERKAAVWDKRVELFGDDAYQIWAQAWKQDQFQARLVDINQSTAGFKGKMDQYLTAATDIYGESVLDPAQSNTTLTLTTFLELEGVQADLHKLPEAERYAQLREFRTALGMDEAALQRWDDLDQERAQVWSQAEIYESERQKLVKEYEGELLQGQLNQLRTDLFGPVEAGYIQKEEQSGFYRFQQPQKLGLN